MRKTRMVILLLMLVLSAGCAEQRRQMRRALLICVCFPIGTVVGVFVILSALHEMARARRHQIESAPANYNKAARAVRDWIPECHQILNVQARRNRAHQAGPLSLQAQEKSLRLIRTALHPARLLQGQEITRPRLESGTGASA